jgi:hypothetical protein
VSRLGRILTFGAVGAAMTWLGACGLLGAPASVPYPEGCATRGFSERRCAGIVDEARRDAPPDPVGIALLAPEADSIGLGGGQVARVSFTYADGSTVVTPVLCIGVPAGPDDAACIEPTLAITSAVSHDVPCAGEPPDGCPSAIVPDQAALAESRPLRIAALDIPIDGIGHKEIRVGGVLLPNGYVTSVDARIVNDQPDDFWLQDSISLDLRPDDPGRPPFGNVYERALVDGPEPATLWLVFDVTEAEPGAVLHLANIVVE